MFICVILSSLLSSILPMSTNTCIFTLAALMGCRRSLLPQHFQHHLSIVAIHLRYHHFQLCHSLSSTCFWLWTRMQWATTNTVQLLKYLTIWDRDMGRHIRRIKLPLNFSFYFILKLIFGEICFLFWHQCPSVSDRQWKLNKGRMYINTSKSPKS